MNAVRLVLAVWAISVLHVGSAFAQSAEIRAVTAWRLQFTYEITSALRAGGQQFDYRVTASGNGVLEPDGEGRVGFSGAPNITVSIDYMGSAIDGQGCGLVEQLTASGAPNCENPTSLELGSNGFELDLRCHRMPVTHSFSWQGSCGEQFPYPTDGAPIVDWPWLAQDVSFDGGTVKLLFPYPASGVSMGGRDGNQLMGFLAPLFTAIATGTPTPLDYTFQFTLTPAEEEDLTLEIDSASYARWRPSAALPNAAGAPLDVTAKLVSSTGRPPSLRIAEVIWELKNTSREPGIAMNFPSAAMDDELDLRFADDGAHVIEDDAQRAVRSNPDGFTDTVRIEPYDWGGWSQLSVTAVLQGGRRIVGKVRGAAEDGLRVPKRGAGSWVADDWKQTTGVTGLADASDADALPAGDGTPGDGLTLYQEYRGFYVGDRHVTGDPKRKDLFVNNLAKGAATAGIARFGRVSGLKVHGELTPQQMTMARVVNGNRRDGPSVTDQHAIIIEVIAAQSGYAAARGGPGNPKTISSVQLMGDWATLDGDYLSKIVAHELFHTVNVYHHGETDEEVTWRDAMGVLVERRRGGPAAGAAIRVLGENGVDATRLMLARLQRMPGLAEDFWLGVTGGQQSGHHDCVMRYNNAETYVSMASASDRYLITQPMGSGLCMSPDGTGPNAPAHRPQSRFGAASAGRGSCRAQLLVTDAVAAPGR
ncbi:MAG: hypothetical protein RMA76_31945 [Deltaproteobacteria bacterium]|jgi:hypothetical protein